MGKHSYPLTGPITGLRSVLTPVFGGWCSCNRGIPAPTEPHNCPRDAIQGSKTSLQTSLHVSERYGTLHIPIMTVLVHKMAKNGGWTHCQGHSNGPTKPQTRPRRLIQSYIPTLQILYGKLIHLCMVPLPTIVFEIPKVVHFTQILENRQEKGKAIIGAHCNHPRWNAKVYSFHMDTNTSVQAFPLPSLTRNHDLPPRNGCECPI